MAEPIIHKDGIDFALKGLRYFHPEVVSDAIELSEEEAQKYRATTKGLFDAYVLKLTQAKDLATARDILIFWTSLNEQELYSNLPLPILETLELSADIAENGRVERLTRTVDLDMRIRQQTKAIPVPKSLSAETPRTEGVSFQEKEKVADVVYSAPVVINLKRKAGSVDPQLTPAEMEKLKDQAASARLDPQGYQKRLARDIYLTTVRANRAILKDSELNQRTRDLADSLAFSFRNKLLHIEDQAIGVNLGSVVAAIANPGGLIKNGVAQSTAKELAKQAIELGVVANSATRDAKFALTPVFGQNIVNALYGSGIQLELASRPEEAEFTVQLAELKNLHTNLTSITRNVFGDDSALLGNQRLRGYARQLIDAVARDTLTQPKVQRYFHNFAASIFFHASKTKGEVANTQLEDQELANLLATAKGEYIEIDQNMVNYAQDPGRTGPSLMHITSFSAGTTRHGVSESSEIAKFKKEMHSQIKAEVKGVVKESAGKLFSNVKSSIATKIMPALGTFAAEIMLPVAGIVILASPAVLVGAYAATETTLLVTKGSFSPITQKFFSFLDKTGNSIVQGAKSGIQTIANIGRGLLAQAARDFAKVAVYAMFAVVFLVAVILFIINSGAYVVPPGGYLAPPGGTVIDDSPYISVTKTANPQGPFDNNFPITIEYTVSVVAKIGVLSDIVFTNTCSVTKEGGSPGCSSPTPPDDPDLVIDPSQPFTFTYSQTYPDANFSDAIVSDSFTVEATEAGGERDSASGVATIVIGDPPGCFNPVGTWPATYRANLDSAIAKLSSDFPGYAAKICGTPNTKINICYKESNGNLWGFHHHLASCDIELYAGGLGSVTNTLYILAHEAGHHLNKINGGLYVQYKDTLGILNELPLCSYSATTNLAEGFAEGIALYVTLPTFWSTRCGTGSTYPGLYPNHYNFVKQFVF